jgi:hypothetical protein
MGLLSNVEIGGNVAYNALLVIVDRYSKVVKYILYQDTVDALGLAWLFLKNWYSNQGMPDSIVLDRGSLFTLKF